MTTNTLAAPARPESLRNYVERFLRDAIATGQFAPGARLIEREICELLNVSRPPLREALRALEAEKLVQIIPHKGPVVASMSLDDARQVYAVRALLESFAIKQFTLNADAAMVKQLGVAVKELNVEAATGDQNRLLAAKTRFYEIIHQGCGNRLVVDMLQGLLTRINLLRATSLTQPERLAVSLDEIDKIYSAIRRRDAEKAEKLAKQHIVNAQVTALGVLGRQLAGMPASVLSTTTPKR